MNKEITQINRMACPFCYKVSDISPFANHFIDRGKLLAKAQMNSCIQLRETQLREEELEFLQEEEVFFIRLLKVKVGEMNYIKGDLREIVRGRLRIIRKRIEEVKRK